MQLLLFGNSHLPLESSNILVLLLDLKAGEVLINLVNVKIELKAEFADLGELK